MTSLASSTVSSTSLFRVSQPRSKYLLIVNKGPGAVTLQRSGTEWDLLEIYFMNSDIKAISADPGLTDAEHVVFETDRQMRKFSIIKAAFEADDFWQHYDAVLMADDDLIPVGCSIGDVFRLFEATKCRVGQPALTSDSYFAHMVTVENSNFVWRKTNFAEVMCPIMSAEGLRQYLPIFNATISGFGLDDYWSYFEWLKGHGLAILDKTPMKHTRPVRGGIAYQGITPEDECYSFMRQHSIPRYPHSCYGGVLRPGVEQRAGIAIAISGYDRRFMHDGRFINYLTEESLIQASQPPAFDERSGELGDGDRIASLRHISGVGLYMAARSTGMLAPIMPLDEVQRLIKLHWDSTSWQKTQGLRNLVNRFRGRPPDLAPVLHSNVVTAHRYLDALRNSTFWRMTGPARRFVEFYRKR